MRRALLKCGPHRPMAGCAVGLLLALTACHESELEPQTPDQVWEEPHSATFGPLEATYTMAPVPAVIDPAPVPRERPRSISLGFVGDQPLTESPPSPPHWPYVQEPFKYHGYGPGGGYGRGHYVRVPRYATRY